MFPTQFLRARFTYANVVSTLCLFLLLSGGVAYAAIVIPAHSVGTNQLKNNAVTSAKIKDHAIRGADLAAGVIPAPVNAYTKAQSDARYYSQSQSNARFLRGTVTVVATIRAIAADDFASAVALCPAGYQAVGGGVDPDNIFYGKVSSSGPWIDGARALSASAGQHNPATGWMGAVTTEGSTVGSGGPSVVVAICAPIG